jgi:threonine dehydratase
MLRSAQLVRLRLFLTLTLPPTEILIMIDLDEIKQAYDRIAPYLLVTPILQSEFLNSQLGHNIIFKAESLQKTGAFKIRGVLNALLSMDLERIKKITCYSTGNHGLALAWAGKYLGIKVEIYMPVYTSLLKQNIVRDYGANLIITETRDQAEQMAFAEGNKPEAFFLAPSDNNRVIAGAGTLFYEAYHQMPTPPDAVFCSIGGGGLISGTYSAAKQLRKECFVIGGEPEIANDAFLSRMQGSIFRFKSSPRTIADGLRTLGLSNRTFEYIKRIDDILLATEDEIIYWTAWIEHLLKVSIEPSCAVAMAAAHKWMKKQTEKQNVLVLISGGNLDQEMMSAVWREDHLTLCPV